MLKPNHLRHTLTESVPYLDAYTMSSATFPLSCCPHIDLTARLPVVPAAL